MPDDAPHTHDHTPELNMRPRHRHIGAAGHLDPGLPPRLQELLQHGKAAATAPFTGLTTDDTARPGLFPLHRTGISLAPVVLAAENFLAALTPAERDTASFTIESDAWREWSNIHPYLMRHGVSLRDLTHAQRGAALALVRESLSATGFTTARNVMKLNDHIRELTGRPEEYGEWYYWLSIFGTPSRTTAMGLADRRPPPDHQLLRAGRPDRADAAVPRIRAGGRHLRPIRRHARVRGRGSQEASRS